MGRPRKSQMKIQKSYTDAAAPGAGTRKVTQEDKGELNEVIRDKDLANMDMGD